MAAPQRTQMPRNLEAHRAQARGAPAACGRPRYRLLEKEALGGPYARKYGAMRGYGRGLTTLATAPLLTNATAALLNPALVSPSSAQSPSQPTSPRENLASQASTTQPPNPTLSYSLLYWMACSLSTNACSLPGLCSAVTST